MEDENRNQSTSYGNLRPKKPRSFDEMDGASWDCSVCTYRNNAEAFKCAICDTRKGTATRKPKVNSQLVAQQTAQQVVPTPAKIQKTSNSKRNSLTNKKGFSQSRLKNIDQNSEQQMEVTVGNVTVVITDYKLLPVKDEKSPPPSPQQQEQVVPVDKEQSDKTSDSGKNENKEHADAQELINS